MERKRLIQCPEFEKVEVATYLANTLSLNQLLAIETLTRTGKIRKVINGTINSENDEQNDVSSEHSKIPNRTSNGRIRYMVID